MITRIETLPEKKLVGKRAVMTFSDNKTFDLWRGFMPRRNEINSRLGEDLFSIQLYPQGFFENFNPETPFEKWAAAEVRDHAEIPEGMEALILPGGLYVVFHYHGEASKADTTFRYILGIWLPQSEYLLDDRPHFEILGAKYNHEDPSSEEDIWIPVKPKNN